MNGSGDRIAVMHASGVSSQASVFAGHRSQSSKVERPEVCFHTLPLSGDHLHIERWWDHSGCIQITVIHFSILFQMIISSSYFNHRSLYVCVCVCVRARFLAVSRTFVLVAIKHVNKYTGILQFSKFYFSLSFFFHLSIHLRTNITCLCVFVCHLVDTHIQHR